MKPTSLPRPHTAVGRRLQKAVAAQPSDELSCMKVLTFVTSIISSLLDIVPLGKIPLRDYLATLIFAAARNVSLHQADRMVDGSPCRRSFQRNLFPLFTLSWMVAKCNELLAGTAAQVVMFVKGKVTLAIDLTEIPFYGKYEDNPDIRGGMAKCGTARFFMYATLFLNLV